MIKVTGQSSLHKQLKTELQSISGGSSPDTLQAQTPIHTMLSFDEIMKFKSQRCPIDLHKPIDPQSQTYRIHHSMEQPHFYSCSFSHSFKDTRRPIQINNGEIKVKGQKCLNPVYFGDNFSEEYCMNWIEYLYHPKIYKTVPCIGHNCNRTFCPKLHQGEQAPKWKQQLQSMQNVKTETKSLLPAVEQLKQIRSCQSKTELIAKLPNMSQLINKTQASIQSINANISQYMQQQISKQMALQTQIRSLAQPGTLTAHNSSHSNQLPAQNDFDRLFFMEQLKIVQDRQHQFKMFRDKDPRSIAALVLQYISAFLNSDGGNIYLGINDQSIVHGIQVNQKWLDQFKLAVDSDGRNHLNPPLIPQKYALRIIPVSHSKKYQLKVIQVKVYPQSQADKKVLTLYKKQCYLRMNASNHRLSASDIMEYMRIVNGKKDLQILSKLQENLQNMSQKEIKDMQEMIGKINGKIGNILNAKKKDKETQSTGTFKLLSQQE